MMVHSFLTVGFDAADANFLREISSVDFIELLLHRWERLRVLRPSILLWLKMKDG